MRDHRYVFDDPGLRPGRVMFEVTNQGDVEHDLALVRLPDDIDTVEEWLEGTAGRSGIRPVYLMDAREPEQVGVFAADLPAGTYGLLCTTEDEDGTPHYKNGMAASFQVGAPSATASPAAAPRPSPSPRGP